MLLIVIIINFIVLQLHISIAVWHMLHTVPQIFKYTIFLVMPVTVHVWLKIFMYDLNLL